MNFLEAVRAAHPGAHDVAVIKQHDLIHGMRIQSSAVWMDGKDERLSNSHIVRLISKALTAGFLEEESTQRSFLFIKKFQ